ncbi:chemotaxis-specific protein-glutamate methyltransferase CheB [Halonotius terrestris]
MRGLITDLLDEGGIPVVGEAKDGVEALEVVKEEQPDAVTMDLEMPRMDGIEAVERIMAEQPTPVLMLSAHTEDGAEVTFEALEKGAVDFFSKPGGEVSMGVSQHGEQLIETVRSVADADLQQASRQTGQQQRQPASASAGGTTTTGLEPFDDTRTVLIGSSTGGPDAVEQVMSELPVGDCRVIIIQHMPEAFTSRFADRLDAASRYDVREASDGARIGAGEALVARGGSHTEITGYSNGRIRVGLIEEDLGLSVHPAVNVTMESAAETIDDPMTGVILTGMGSDGTDGICAIQEAGGRTVAQDEESCVIYGMPKRAIEAGCIDAVCDINDIATTIREMVQ